jgi:hypothetical protein
MRYGHWGVHKAKPVRNPNMQRVCLEQPGFARFLVVFAACCVIACCSLAVWSGKALAQTAKIAGPYPVGMKQMEYIDPTDGRHLAFALFYPAAPPDNSAPFYHMPFFTNLHLYMNSPVVADTLKRPLIMFSRGAGSNGLYYAWFGQFLAAHGYLVAMLYHYRANTYDSTVMYTRSKLWRRPRARLIGVAGVNLASVVLSLNASFMFTGFALGAALGSVTIAHSSPAALGFVGAASIAAGLILVFAITREKKTTGSAVVQS